MCLFITATVPHGTKLERVNAISRPYGFQFAPEANAFVERQLPPGSVYLSKAAARCDCDTVLGSLRHRDYGHDQHTLQRGAEKLRRRGWGSAKIQRWLADKQSRDEKRRRQVLAPGSPRQLAAAEWLAFLQRVVGELSHFGVLLHDYRDGPSTDQVSIRRIEPVSVQGVSEESLMRVEDEVLYLYRR